MPIGEEFQSGLEYGRDLLEAAARGGRAGFSEAEPITASCSTWLPGAVGAGLGVLAAATVGRKSAVKLLAGGIVGGALGALAGLVWENRELVGRTVGGVVEGTGRVRDAKWLEDNPIDYA